MDLDNKRILLDHGSGGISADRLIRNLIIKNVQGKLPQSLEDSAVIDIPSGNRLAFSTDSFVVDPLFFPGGDIGMLAVHGTVNDIAMRGAKPASLSLALIIEEGFLLNDLEKIMISIGQALKKCGVPVVTGDTKVVPKGGCDKIFINTSGVGFLPFDRNISSRNARPGDVVLLSGTAGDHGITIMTSRAGISISGGVESDTSPLDDVVLKLLDSVPEGAVHVLRDPTRGGLATALNEISEDSGVSVEIDEKSIPIKNGVRSASDILGLDPMYLANEGIFIAVVADEFSREAVEIISSFSNCRDAAVIGRIRERDRAGKVVLNTLLGGVRIVPSLHGNPLPRIC